MHLSKLALSLLLLSTALRARACDLCGCYTPRLEVVHRSPFTFYTGVGEQFTHFSTDRLNGAKVENPTGQHLDSSITQVVLGATFAESRFGLQVGIPYIYRSFKRPAGFAIEHGEESGLGDVSLLANVLIFKTQDTAREERESLTKDGQTTVIRRRESDFSASVNVLAGVKFPTGDESRVKEEFAESEIEGAPASGIHGHDLALGTGSYDGIVGLQTFVRSKALFFEGNVQFTLRGRGHYTYRYANDLQWNGGPGVYLYRRDGHSLALQCAVSGETKGYDRFQGESALDTGVTSLYVGPRVTASWGKINGDLGLDLPVITHTTNFQTTPDYRLHAGLSIHF